MSRCYIKDIDDIIAKVKNKIPHFDIERFINAYKFALKAHKGQKRKEGVDYITHPIETVKILADLRVDENTLIAAMLHDVEEDTPKTIDDIQKVFGEHVAFLVNGVSKLSKVYYKNDMEKRQIESLRKLLLHTTVNPRVIFIKLADRLHNMRTIKFVNPKKQSRIAKETLEVYVPIANLMGIQGVKNELEDLCFKNLYPNEYMIFSNKIQNLEKDLKHMADRVTNLVLPVLKKNKIKAEIIQRKKSIFTIFKKIKSLRKTADDIFDLITLRIIAENVEDCYKTLGIIHSLFKPDPGRFKDYIAVPKINGYQSLHTIVFSENGVPIEFQIRTKKMHEDSETGINFIELKSIPRKLLNWMEQILELQKDEPGIDYFMRDIKSEILSDRIMVFDNKGNSAHLPVGSCVIDFIYAIDPNKIDNAVEAEINRRRMPLTAMLSRNNKIKIIVSEKKHEPKIEWLQYIKTNLARAKIREKFKDKGRSEKISIGKRLLQKSFNITDLGFVEDVNFKEIQDVLCQKTNCSIASMQDLYSSVGDGTILPFDVIKFIYFQKSSKKDKGKDDKGFFGTAIGIDKKVRILIEGRDRAGFANDVTEVLRAYNISMIKIVGWVGAFTKKVYVTVDFVTPDLYILNEIVKKLQLIPDTIKVERKSIGQFYLFIGATILTIAVWLAHPFIIKEIASSKTQYTPLIIDLFIYGGLSVNLLFVIFLKKIMERNFPGIRRGKIIWITTGLVICFAAFMIGFEIYSYDINPDAILATIIILLAILYIAINYFEYCKIKTLK